MEVIPYKKNSEFCSGKGLSAQAVTIMQVWAPLISTEKQINKFILS